MAEKKRVLILTADAGFGHRSAAKAIAAALEESHGGECVYEIVNALDHEKTPAWLRAAQSDYDRIAREAADLYRFTYEASDTALARRIMENALRVLLYRALRDIVLTFKPDAIVSTYPLYQAALNTLFTLRRSFVPVVCVVTDLATVHQVWFSGEADLTIVPTEIVRGLALSAGIPADRVEVIGIPVHPRIAAIGSGASTGKAAFKRALGWDPDRPALLAVGSKRVAGLVPALDVLNHSALPIQIAAVAGGDETLLEALLATEWHLPAKVYGFVDDMPSLFRAADFVIAKAGGLIVTESLAAGLPIVFVDMIPGQETGNADFVVHGGAGEIARDPATALEIVYHWLADGGKSLAMRAAAAKALGRPRAAFDIVEKVWERASCRPISLDLASAPAAKIRAAKIRAAKIRELFGRFNESWEE